MYAANEINSAVEMEVAALIEKQKTFIDNLNQQHDYNETEFADAVPYSTSKIEPTLTPDETINFD